jgi:hypothetical protein
LFISNFNVLLPSSSTATIVCRSDISIGTAVGTAVGAAAVAAVVAAVGTVI